jgi:hypothetical protein
MTAGEFGPGATGPQQVTIDPDASLALCCSGGGIRSATFNLGAIQALQSAPAFAAVKLITAVSGGSYLAAAHALVAEELARPGLAARPSGQPPRAAAYSLRSPEELHLRDHTRYLLETWQVAVRAVATLIRGVVVNALLAGSVIFVCAQLAGWLAGPGALGILSGVQSTTPVVTLGRWWLIPAGGAALTIGLAWLHALPEAAVRSAALRRLRGAQPPRRRRHWPRGERPARPSNQALVFTLATVFALVLAPLAIKGLLTVSLGNGSWSVLTRFLGLASAQACHDAAAAASAGHQVCGAAATAGAAVSHNAHAASTWQAKVVSFGGIIAAVVTLARATLGRLRTFRAELSTSGIPASIVARVSTFLRQRLAPWTGSVLIVAIIAVLTLRWIADGASRSPLSGGAASQLAECGYAVALFLLVKIATDINATSMHGFYRDRLAAAYGVVRDSSQDGGVRAEPGALLSALGRRTPTLIVCAAANCTADKDLPPGRGCVSFTFTPDDVGLSRECRAAAPFAPGRDRAPTTAYERAARLRLFDAVAVSGAAISPVMGKLTRPSMRILLAAANVRLGVWLPSPWSVAQAPGAAAAAAAPGRRRPQRVLAAIRRHWHQPDLRHLWAEAAGSLHLDGRWLYVTDGGHYDNLGLIEALRRRPDHLIVIDASGDGPGKFTTLGQAIALARSEVGADVRIDPGGLRAGPGAAQCRDAYAHGTFTYPDDTGPAAHHLFYMKLAVPAGAPWDILAYQDRHPSFPTDSTLQQLYDDEEFEAYRELGYYCASAILAEIAYDSDSAAAEHAGHRAGSGVR